MLSQTRSPHSAAFIPLCSPMSISLQCLGFLGILVGGLEGLLHMEELRQWESSCAWSGLWETTSGLKVEDALPVASARRGG